MKHQSKTLLYNNTTCIKQNTPICIRITKFGKFKLFVKNKNDYTKYQQIITTEIGKYTKITSLENIHNNFIYEILSNTTLLTKITQNLNEHKPLCNPNIPITHIGKTKLWNYIRNNEFTTFSQYNTETPEKRVYCEIDKDIYIKPVIQTYPYFFINIITTKHKEDCIEWQFLNSINGTDFFYENEDIRIFPNFIYSNLTPDTIKSWNKIKNMVKENITLYYRTVFNLLQNIGFIIFLRNGGDIDNYKYNSIFDLTDINYLEGIKENVYTFYNKFFDNKLDDFKNIICHNSNPISISIINPYNNFILLECGIRDNCNSFIPNSFIHHSNIYNLNLFIEILKDNNIHDKITYIKLLNEKDCPKSHKLPYIMNKMPSFTKQYYPINKNGLSLLENDNEIPNKIKIKNEWYKNNIIHTPNSIFLAIKAYYPTKPPTYFELSMKSITYSTLKTNNYPDFNMEYVKEINQLNQEINTSYKKLPAMIELYVKNIDTIQKQKNAYFIEKSTIYKEKIRNKIKQSKKIRIDIIINLCWKSEFRRLCNKYKLNNKLFHNALINPNSTFDNAELYNFYVLTNKIIKIPGLGYYIMDNFTYSTNFIFGPALNNHNFIYLLNELSKVETGKIIEISKETFNDNIKKLLCENIYYQYEEFVITKDINRETVNEIKYMIYEYINKTTLTYILWNVPEELTLNYIIIDKINEFYIGNIPDFTQNYEKIIDSLLPIIEENTNFYQLYKNERFIYNIRELNEIHKEEINSFIDNKLFYYCNYPLERSYSIFHMHCMHINNISKHKLLVNGIYNFNMKRAINYNKEIKNIDYSNKDMILQINLIKPIKIEKYLELFNLNIPEIINQTI